jgi:hypothetical protein
MRRAPSARIEKLTLGDQVLVEVRTDDTELIAVDVEVRVRFGLDHQHIDVLVPFLLQPAFEGGSGFVSVFIAL